MDKTDNTDARVNPANAGGPWKESLFDCCSDMKICCCGFCCSPCLFGTNAEKIDGSNCIACSLLYYLLGGLYLCWVPHMMKRKLLRQKYGLREEPCNDCLVTAFCGPCANCQDARELRDRAGPQVGPNRMPVRAQPAVAYRR